MKAKKCYLICYTRWGTVCHRMEYNSINEAMREKKELIDEGYAFSYILYNKIKTKIIKKGF